MRSRLFPHPLLTVTLTVTWLLLVNHFSPGNLLLGLVFGTLLPLMTEAYWPNRPKLRRPLAFAGYCLMVMWDIVLANVAVARIVLFMPNDRIRSAWITLPLDLRSPEAISVLAGTITLTPGTVTADMSACGRSLLIHSLHAPDPDAIRDAIKSRYERRLMRIFE
jgi:multicomponent K+:H+ antiporter subunit E